MLKELRKDAEIFSQLIDLDDSIDAKFRQGCLDGMNGNEAAMNQATTECAQLEDTILSFGIDANITYLQYLRKRLRTIQSGSRLGIYGVLDVSNATQRLGVQTNRLQKLLSQSFISS